MRKILKELWEDIGIWDNDWNCRLWLQCLLFVGVLVLSVFVMIYLGVAMLLKKLFLKQAAPRRRKDFDLTI